MRKFKSKEQSKRNNKQYDFGEVFVPLQNVYDRPLSRQQPQWSYCFCPRRELIVSQPIISFLFLLRVLCQLFSKSNEVETKTSQLNHIHRLAALKNGSIWTSSIKSSIKYRSRDMCVEKKEERA